MTLLLTLTAFPPAIGGAQLTTHRLAKVIASRSDFRFRVVTQWVEGRFDWLLGTTLCAPSAQLDYRIDGVEVQRLGLSTRDRLRALPFVVGYYLAMPLAIDRISDMLCERLEGGGRGLQLVHNVRLGRENLSYASWKLARRRGLPFVFTPLFHERWQGWRHRSYLELCQRADALIVMTDSERRFFEDMGVPPDRIWKSGAGPILAESASGDRFRERHLLGPEPVVLFVGQKFRYKGWEPLLAARQRIWAKLPNARLVFVGPRTRYSRRVFGRCRDSRILELGGVGLREKTDAIAACDILCVPSSQESLGVVYAEAWALGKPVIGGPATAVREVISDGRDGYLVEQECEAIAARVVELLRDPDLRARMGERGRAKAASRFAWETIAERTIDCYEHLIG